MYNRISIYLSQAETNEIKYFHSKSMSVLDLEKFDRETVTANLEMRYTGMM